MIEHTEMMNDANALLEIWSMLLSWQVPHRTNSSQLFWNGIFRKKNIKQGAGEWGGGGHTFFGKNAWNCFGFSLFPWKFLKENSTPGNLVKLFMLHPLEISRPKTNEDPWKLYMNFSWSPLDISCCF